MRWDYPDEYRDEFSKGPHRDILIVPHATDVTPVAGGPPIVTSKVPEFNSDGSPKTDGQGNFIMSDVEWTITNKDIVKEKFKYNYNLNPSENISFTCAASAMVQFTIRNNKEYNPDTDTWELDIPNLQYYYRYDTNGNIVLGELDGNYIIKVYTYINGDSSSLLCLGMFRVEEDKAVDNGYNREITAYDFMATFRDMDIFNWYEKLFNGINKLDNDYLDYTNKTGTEDKKPDEYDADKNWVRKPSKKLAPYSSRDGRWTIGEALTDLINNLAAFDMIVFDSTVQKALVGCTTTNPSVYARDYGDGCGYSGLGMPVVLDPDLFEDDQHNKKEYYIPDEPGPDEYECYGYMDALNIEFYPDPNIIKQGSLSMGKFLEDIGLLAGRYPMIRSDKFQDGIYKDPSTVTDPKGNRYNNYECCILTFKPLPSRIDDSSVRPEQQFSNTELVRGFQHSLFTVKDVMTIKIGMQDGNNIEYKILNKTQRDAALKNQLQTFSFSNNIFCSYLVDDSDNEDIKKLLPEYKTLKEKIFGTEKKNGNMTAGAKFEQGYYNIKNRSYVPYQLQTYGDPCRDVGDRIKINFTDLITGETTSFYTYILERTLEGIQKMMDTYKANGAITSPVFSNYQAGTKYESGFGMNVQILGYRNSITGGNTTDVEVVTPNSLVSYLRNVGIRLLDEPLVASAKFVAASMDTSATYYYSHILKGYRDDNEQWVDTWDGVEPTEGDTSTHNLYWDNSAHDDDPEFEPWSEGYHQIEADQPFDMWSCYYDGVQYTESNEGFIYALNGQWIKHNYTFVLTDENYANFKNFITPEGLKPGDTEKHLTINGIPIDVKIGDCIYSEFDDIEGLDDAFNNDGTIGAFYIYPGVWSTEPDYSVVSDYHNLIRYYSEYIGYTASERAVTRFVFSPIVNEYEIKYEQNNSAWFNPLLPYDPTATKLTINGHYDVDISYGGHIRQSYNNYNGYTNMEYDNYLIYPNVWVNSSSGFWSDYNDQHNITIKFKGDPYVELKWEDPSNINTYEPHTATWVGTMVIRKEDSAPKNRWDGIKIVNSTTRDQYKVNAYKDTNVEVGKKYYYAFMPYFKAREEDGHNINFFRYTKVIEVNTNLIYQGDSPTPVPVACKLFIFNGEVGIDYGSQYAELNCSAEYSQTFNYKTLGLYGKIGSNPKCDISDDYINDTLVLSDLDYPVYAYDLKPESTYYFQLIVTDYLNKEYFSNVFSITTLSCVSITEIYYDADYECITVIYSIIEGNYSSIMIYGKKGSNPSFDNTDDIVEYISEYDTYVDLYTFDGDSTYYFGIQAIDYDSNVYTSNIEHCNTPGLPIWRSVPLLGTAQDTVIPITIDNDYLETYGDSLGFNHQTYSWRYDRCRLDTSKITYAGKKFGTDYFMQIGRALPYGESTSVTLYDNGLFTIDIYLTNSQDLGVMTEFHTWQDNGSAYYFDVSEEFMPDDSLSFGFVETGNYESTGTPGAAFIFYQESSGEWYNTHTPDTETLYNLLHTGN